MSMALIPKADYQQIFRTIYSVFEHERLDLQRACVGFNVIGAVLLNEFYGIDARPFAGIAAYCICSEPKAAIVFASEKDGMFVPTDGGFHCWIESKDWVVDFTAPLFPLIVKQRNVPDPGPKMMQRRTASAKVSPADLTSEGDFFVHPDQDFTKHALGEFAQVQFHQDLIRICKSWFVRPPKPMQSKLPLANQDGKITFVTFSKFQVTGAW